MVLHGQHDRDRDRDRDSGGGEVPTATRPVDLDHAEPENAKARVADDFLPFTASGISATASGALHHLPGWQALSLLVVPGLLFVAGIALLRPGTRPASGGQPIPS
jgi:hypothetical protein